MHRRLLLPTALLLCAVFAAPAMADYRVGLADQSAKMFSTRTFDALDIERVRYLVPYDWYKVRGNRDEVVTYMREADAAGVQVLVHFTAPRGCFDGGRYSRSRKCRLPSVRAYRSAFARFRREYPGVKEFGVWNEANHQSQPTARNPRRAAQYFLAARSVCRSCTFVAADLLDGTNMIPWVTTFLRYAKGKARIFGLHNYGDVNYRRSTGTQALLRRVPGQVWLTETGGILKFLPRFKRSESRQASATRFMFALADRYSVRRRGLRARITRVYNYQFTGAKRSARFDAGLVSENGAPRKAFGVFKALAAKHDR